MEADAEDWRAETDMVLEMVDDPDTIISGVIANCRPEDPGFDTWLDTIADRPVVGLRRILHVMPDELSKDEAFRVNIRKLAGRGLTFDLCFLGRQLAIAADLARASENVQFVLDHCGVPDIASGEMDPWREQIRSLATLPNVACKISGVTAYAKPGEATIDVVRPWVENCIECFGWDRVIWGSDWPVCNINAGLAEWVAISRGIVANEDVSNQAKLFRDNAINTYGLRKWGLISQ
ncbi:MAG: amidohydrolase family protein [Geminicoccales bacterium]